MKKFLFLIAVCCLTTTATKAQDVLNEIVKTSLSITNDTTLSREVRKAAVFKYDAMSYLRSKVLPPNVLLEQKISADSLNACIKMLNEQAYAMNQYVTLYQKRLSEAKKRNKGMVRSLFKQATIDHKLFNDSDTEITLAYFNRSDSTATGSRRSPSSALSTGARFRDLHSQPVL